jgi:tricorn protease
MRGAYSIVILSLSVALTQAQGTSITFQSRPDIHGDQVAFVAEGDIWVGDLTTKKARRLTTDSGLETMPHFSPDGKWIAFTGQYEGRTDVYVISAEGGASKRLTFNPRRAEVQGWTPDGQSILFRSPYRHETYFANQLYTVPMKGGLPKMLPIPEAQFGSMAGDGRRVAFVQESNEWMNWFRYEGGANDQIWLADLEAKKFTKLTDTRGVETTPVWIGDDIAFVSERTGIRNLYRLNPVTKKTEALTDSKIAVKYPSSDGKRVVFELGGGLGLADPSKKTWGPITFDLSSDFIHRRVQTIPAEANLTGASISPSGKRVILETRGQLISVPAGQGEVRTIEGNSGERAQLSAWSPDGKKLAYVSDESGEEQLYLFDFATGKEKQLTTKLTGQHSRPIWSPDNNYILIGDRDMHIQLVDAATGEVTLVDQPDRNGSYDTPANDFTFSPDGRWIAFSKLNYGWVNGVHLYSLDTKKITLVTDPRINSVGPAFSPDGKYLFCVQDRQLDPVWSPVTSASGYDAISRVTAFPLAATTPSLFAPKSDEEGAEEAKPEEAKKGPNGLPITKIDLDGIQARAFDAKVRTGRYASIVALPGKLLILGFTDPQFMNGRGPSLFQFDLASRGFALVEEGVSMVQVTADRSKALIMGPAGLQVVDAGGGPITPDQGLVKISDVNVTVDPVKEWRQIFYESWRVGRDFFYDPNLHGVNWNAVKAKYEAMLDRVGDRTDLSRICSDMVAELNTGHCYVVGPTPFAKSVQPLGMLGADLEWDPAMQGYRIKSILRAGSWDLEARSPLSAPGLNIKEGDVIFAIGGKPVSMNEDPQALLIGAVGRPISIKVGSKPAGVDARNVRIVPIANERQLRYFDGVERRREYVEKASGGKITYLHMSDMTANGHNGFWKDYQVGAFTDAIIVDVRNNGGGNISMNIMSNLLIPVSGYFKPRYGESWRREGWATDARLACITNSGAFSDGEYFSYFWRKNKLGPLIGQRTGGGEVGSGGGYSLVDGGQIYIPNYGAWTADEGKWIIEGTGAVPDMEVAQDPNLVIQGKDPQLDRAIAYLLDSLKKNPPKKPTPPPFPVKLKGSSGGGR